MTNENLRIQAVMQRLRQAVGPELLPALSPSQLQLESQISQKEKARINQIRQLSKEVDFSGKPFDQLKNIDDNQLIAYLVKKVGEAYNLTPFDEQIAAIIRLAESLGDEKETGRIFEMATSEGKSKVVIPLALSFLAAKTDSPIHLHTVTPSLAQRDYNGFCQFAETLGIADQVGLATKVDDENLQKKIAFGHWSVFIHSYQTRFLQQQGNYPQTPPILVLDEIDQLLQDESETPAIISQTVKKKELIEGVLTDLKSSNEENNQDKPNEWEIKIGFADKTVKLSREQWPAPENEQELKELMKVMVTYGNDLLKETDFLKTPRPKQEIINYLMQNYDFYFFVKVVHGLLGKQTPFNEGEIRQLRQRFDQLDKDRPIFIFENPDLQQGLFSALTLREGEDYFINNKKIIVKAATTGYSEPSKQFNSLTELFLCLKHNLPWPKQLTDVTLDRLEVASFYRRQQKIFGFTGTASPVASQLFGLYRLATEIIPKHFPDNRKLTVEPVNGFNEKKLKLQGILSSKKVNTIVIVESDKEKDKLMTDLSENYDIKTLAADNEAEDQQLFDWIGQAGEPSEKQKLLICVKMAGRGIDIRLDEKTKAQGLRLVSFTSFLSERDFNQLVGRVGRRGEAGEAILLLSPDDSVFKSLSLSERDKLADNLKKLPEQRKKAWKQREDEIYATIKSRDLYLEVIDSLRDWLEGKKELYWDLEQAQKDKIKQYVRSHWSGIRWYLDNMYYSFASLQSAGPLGQGDPKPIWVNLALEKIKDLGLRPQLKTIVT